MMKSHGASAPHDLEAERATLGAILSGVDMVGEVLGIVDPADFFSPPNETIATVIMQLQAKGSPIDSLLVAEELRASGELAKVGGRAYLHELVDGVVVAANAVYHAEIVARMAQRRRIQRVLVEAHQRLDQGLDLAGAMDEMRTQLAGPLAGMVSGRSRVVDGACFVLDTPHDVPCIWGVGKDVGWAQGEALTIVGPPGVGKTTLVGQLARARMGLDTQVLGMPVAPGTGRVLYLAMDRPAQIARSMARLFHEDERSVLAEGMRVIQGPPPTDLAKNPHALARLAAEHKADTVVLDSLKDAALGLSDDETGAAYNSARQLALAEGVEVLELHHNVKRGSNGAEPRTLEDVYGSRWITAGSGSVIFLWGKPGDPLVELRHLKQPSGELGPWHILHNHETGRSSLFEPTNLLAIAASAGGSGLTSKVAACALFSTTKPTAAEIEKARRQLERLTEKGQLEQTTAGNKAKRIQSAWKVAYGPRNITTPFTPLPDRVDHHDAVLASRATAAQAVKALHGEHHGHHEDHLQPGFTHPTPLTCENRSGALPVSAHGNILGTTRRQRVRPRRSHVGTERRESWHLWSSGHAATAA